jgi:RNA polymerase sigma-70 factor, ECF subfamily
VVPELSDRRSEGGVEADRLGDLIASHERDLRRLAMAITADRRTAADALLATWILSRRRLQSLAGSTGARTWLLRTVDRQASQRLRRPWWERLLGWTPLPRRRAPDPDPGADRDLVEALRAMTVEDRRMLTLALVVGLPTEEIAGQLQLTGAGVRTHLAELRDQLRSSLGIAEEEHPGQPRSDREVERRIGQRLVAHLDRGAEPVDARQLARAIVSRRARPAHRRRRPLLVGVVAAGIVLTVAGLAALGPLGPGETSAEPTPSPGTLVPLTGWSEKVLANLAGPVRALAWAPDGEHVAVLGVPAGEIIVYDRDGNAVDTFSGQGAVWVDASHLLATTSSTNGPYGVSNLTLRSIGTGPDLLLSGTVVGATSILGGGGVAAVLDPFAGRVDATTQSFSVLRNGAFSAAVSGLPVAWSPDGSRLAFLPSPADFGDEAQGILHVLDAATLADRNLGVAVLAAGINVIDPTGRWLLTCMPQSTFGPCTLAIVDLRDGTVQASSLPGTNAVAAWSADGSVVVRSGRSVLRWAVDDSPVALRWQPDPSNTTTLLLSANHRILVGMLHGPGSASVVAGTQPALILMPASGAVRSAAVSPDGSRVLYIAESGSSSQVILATLPPNEEGGAAPSSAASGIPAGPTLNGIPIVAVGDAVSVEAPEGDLVGAWGPRVYLRSPYGTEPATLTTIQLETGESVAIALPLLPGEELGQVQSDGSHLLVMTGRRLGPASDGRIPCSSELTQPLAWRILVAPLDATGLPEADFAELASGTASRAYDGGGQGISCAATYYPMISIDAGRVAYAVEAPTAAAPWRSRLVVRRLPDGAAIESRMTAAPVQWVGLAGAILAWTEAPDASVAPAGGWSLFAWFAGTPEPRAIPIQAGLGAPVAAYFQLVGSWLQYPVYSLEGAEQPSSVWQMHLPDGERERLSPPGAPGCWPQGGAPGIAFMQCASTSSGGQYLLVWRQGAGWSVLDGISWTATGVLVGGDWAVLGSQSDSGTRVQGFPLSDLSPSP